MTATHVTDATFEQAVLKAPGPVLVDFWAEWCGPCKMIAPALEEIAKEMAGQITIAKMNVDENRTTPTRYGIRSIPTLILFRNGEVADAKIGALPKARIAEWLRSKV